MACVGVGEEHAALVAQGHVERAGEVGGDDNVAGHVLQLNGHLKVFFVGLAEGLEGPEYGGESQKEEENEELLVLLMPMMLNSTDFTPKKYRNIKWN